MPLVDTYADAYSAVYGEATSSAGVPAVTHATVGDGPVTVATVGEED